MKRWLLTLFLACAAYAQTTVSDTIRTPFDTTLFSGKVTISAPTMTVGTTTYAAWRKDYSVTAGVFSAVLRPNDTATPAGTYYTVYYTPQRGSGWTEYWIVPTSVTAVTISTLRTVTLPSPSLAIPLSQLTQSSASLNQVPSWNGTAWVPATVSGVGGSVSSVFGRDGAVTAQSGDYSAYYQPLDSDLTTLAGKTLVGNGVNVRMSSGSYSTDDCVKVDASGNFVTAGAACGSGSMTYPGAGVPNSTGSAWGTSYTVGTGANNLVQLNGSSQLPAVSAALLTNFPTLNQNTTGTAAGLTSQYIDWSLSSGSASIANKPTLGDAAAKNTGTTTGTVAAGDHNHSAVYQPLDTDLTTLAGKTLVGTGANLRFSTGSVSTDDCAKFDANGNIVSAGAACGTASGAPTDATYIVQTLTGGLSNEQSLGALTTGLLLNTVTAGTGVLSTAAASDLPAHASRHQNGGNDEIATATAAANAIPKAGAGGTLATGWIPDLSATYAAAAKGVTNGDSHDHSGGDGGQIAYSSLGSVPSTFAPSAHASAHISTGGDAIAGAVAGGASGLMTGSDKTKLDGIASGAEVNVNADWSASSGDAQILNKPTLGTAAAANLGTGAAEAAYGNHSHATLHTQGTDTGTTSATFQIDSGNTGPKLKNSSGTVEVRNAADNAYSPLKVLTLEIVGDGNPSSITAAAAPAGTPSAGTGYYWLDSTDKTWKLKDDAGNTSTTVRGSAAVSNQFVRSLTGAGVVSYGAIADADVPDTITVSNYLPLAGGTMTGQLVSDNLGIEFEESDTNPTCAAGNFNIFADASENKLKKCVNGSVSDLDTTGGTVGFADVAAGSNTNTLTIGTGGSLAPTGTGTIEANVAPTEAYDASGWDGDTAPPQKDAVRDKIETLAPKADPVFTGSAQIPNGTGPTVDAAGEIAVDTTTDQLQFYGGAKRALPSIQVKSFTIIAPVATDDFLIMKAPYGMTIVGIDAIIQGTTNVVGQLQECDSAGANCADLDSDITVDNDGAADDGTLTDSAIASGGWIKWKTTSVSGTPDALCVTFKYRVVPD